MSTGRGFRLRYAYTGYNTEHRTPLRRLINFLCNLTTRHCENGENYATAHRNFPRFLIITSDALLPPPPTSFHPPPSPKLGADLTREIFNFSGGPDLFVYSGSLYVRTLSVWSVSDLSSVKWNWSKVVDGMLRKVFQVIDRSIDNVEDDLKLGISSCSDFMLRWRRVFNKLDWKIVSVCRFGYVSSGVIWYRGIVKSVGR